MKQTSKENVAEVGFEEPVKFILHFDTHLSETFSLKECLTSLKQQFNNGDLTTK